jgi:hypothetical protein
MNPRLLLLLVLLALPLHAADPKDDPKPVPPKEAPKEAPKDAKDAPKEAPKDAKEAPKEPPKPKNIDETVKEFEKLPGVFTLYRKLEANKQKLFLELPESELNKPFLLQATFSSGSSGAVNSGSPIGDVVLQWEKLPDERIALVSPSLGYRVRKDSPQAVAVEREFPETFVEVFTPAAKQDDRKALLLEVSDFFRTGMIGSGKVFDTSSFSVDGGKSFYTSVKNFPENTVVQVQYNFTRAASPMMAILGGGGPKSFPAKVNFNLFALTQGDYVPRLADPRVGYFVNGYFSQRRVGFDNFDNDSKRDPRIVYINRWRLEKADPNAALSLPKKPIVFWIDRAFPTEYRAAAEQGLLMWNKAFERIGFKDAIVVKQMPDNADWDHADLRYNVIRWVTTAPTPDSAMAVALIRENPLTGEIINANININANWVRFGRAEVQDVVNPGLNPKAQEKNHAHDDPAACSYGYGLNEQAWLGWQALEMQMAVAPRVKVDETEYANALLRSVVAHEMGHILGLRHNFTASTLHDDAALSDAKTVAQNGLSSSVMDYTGFNLYGLKKQGVELFSSTIGPYDYWAIEYGYKSLGAKTPEDEVRDLKAIAARTNEPGLAYQTDDLADNYDPLIVRYDLGKDPLKYLETMSGLNRELMQTLGERLPKRGEDYGEFTRAFYRLMNGNASRAIQAARYIGGMNARKNNRGDINEKPNFAPVPASEQRRALKLINTYVFAADAVQIPADYFTKMAPDPYAMIDSRALNGFPARNSLANAQIAVMRTLFDPERLNRMADNEFKMPSRDMLTQLELFRSVQATVWSELAAKSNIGALHRDLQRGYLDLMISLATADSRQVPADSKMLAWDNLRRLKNEIAAARKGQLDAYTRLHLEESQNRIQRMLEAKTTVAS